MEQARGRFAGWDGGSGWVTTGSEVFFFFLRRNYPRSVAVRRSSVGHEILGFCKSKGGLSSVVKYLLIREI